MKPRIVLAYDGSPDGSNAIAWLADEHDADVVTLTLDIGGGAPLDGVRDASLGRGAIRAHVLEVHEEFARAVAIPAAQAGTWAAGVSLAAIVRPLLAKKLVDVARIEKASAVAFVTHGEDDGGLEAQIAVLDPSLSVLVRQGSSDARQPVATRRPSPASAAIATPAHVEIAFKDSLPTSINGIAMRLPELLESLATIAAEHGIASGEHAFVPAVTVLHAAYVALAPARDGAVRLKLSNGEYSVSEPVKLES
jgi:argininosuccinate synthase